MCSFGHVTEWSVGCINAHCTCAQSMMSGQAIVVLGMAARILGCMHEKAQCAEAVLEAEKRGREGGEEGKLANGTAYRDIEFSPLGGQADDSQAQQQKHKGGKQRWRGGGREEEDVQRWVAEGVQDHRVLPVAPSCSARVPSLATPQCTGHPCTWCWGGRRAARHCGSTAGGRGTRWRPAAGRRRGW